MNGHVHFNVLLQTRFSKLHDVCKHQRSYSRHTSDLPLSSIINPVKPAVMADLLYTIYFWTIIGFQCKMNNAVFNPTELNGDDDYKHYISSYDS